MYVEREGTESCTGIRHLTLSLLRFSTQPMPQSMDSGLRIDRGLLIKN